MSDEQPVEQPTGDAPTDDAGDDMEVVLKKSQLDAVFTSGRNSAYAEMRKRGELKREKQHDDPRVQAGLQLLEQYEKAEFQYGQDVRSHQRKFARHPEWDPSGREPVKPEILKLGKPTASQPAQAQQGELSQLLELMRLDIASRMADKLLKAPVTYASPMDGVHAEINAQIGAIDKTDPKYHDKVRETVMDRMKDVKLTPTTQRVPVNPNKK